MVELVVMGGESRRASRRPIASGSGSSELGLRFRGRARRDAGDGPRVEIRHSYENTHI